MAEKGEFSPLSEDEYKRMEGITPEIEEAKNKGLLANLDETIQDLEIRAREILPSGGIREILPLKQEAKLDLADNNLLELAKSIQDYQVQMITKANKLQEIGANSGNELKQEILLFIDKLKTSLDHAKSLCQQYKYAECEEVCKLIVEALDTALADYNK